MNLGRRSLPAIAIAFVFAALISACGGGVVGDGGVSVGASSYTIGGNVTGLAAGASLAMQDNNGDTLTVTANSTFTFATKIVNGGTYSVTVSTQPTGQTCSVSTGAGTVSGNNVSNVAVVCSINTYSVGGTVSGLVGSMVLQDNNGDNLTVTANGAFTFATKVANGSSYSVTVLTQPTGQTCSVSTGAGTVSGGNVTNVAVVCSTNTYNVGGTVSGLTGSLVLQDNNGDNLSVATNGTFTFSTKVANGSPYSVTVLTHPASQSCSVTSGTGTISLANITNVAITCATSTYTIGGTVTGLSGSMVLQDNGGDNLTVSANGTFAFATVVAYGNAYSVTVFTQPVGQICTLTGGSGMVTANVVGITVNCVSNVGSTLAWFAGSMTGGYLDGIGTGAQFNQPHGIKADSAGNLYVADNYNYLIRKITPAGVVTTFAGTANVRGSADGTGTAASFYFPQDIAIDSAGNLFVTDFGNSTIRMITPAGVVTTFAGTAGVIGGVDGVGSAARFNYPAGITIDSSDNLYVADTGNNMIRKISPAGVVTTFAGKVGTIGGVDGTGAAASFNSPIGVAADSAGNIYVADSSNCTIRKITAAGVVTTFAGQLNVHGHADGTGPAATFLFPQGVSTDSSDNVYVSDTNNDLIRKITPAGVVTTVAGVAGQNSFIAGTLPASLMSSGSLTISGPLLFMTNAFGIGVITHLP